MTPSVALQRLLAVSRIPKGDFSYLNTYGPEVQRASKAAPKEWQRWWWVCAGAELFLLPSVVLMKGRWSPKRARDDELEHAQRIEAELAQMAASV